MNHLNTKSHAGIALLIFLVMMMGIGGFVLVGYSQGILKQVEASKFEHNQRVLKEAKQALLQFAYNYPVTNGKGPGRLPCADIDNDGDANTTFGDCTSLGRLPWNEPNLNLYDIRDADGQRLWYAVSDAFATNVSGGNIINSDTSGTITLRDQSGNIIYDGSNPLGLFKYGVAAIIFAPGDITARNGVAQDRSVTNADDPFDTTADTDPAIITAANYLDRLVGTEDNADFTQDSATDGFILGPTNTQSSDAINDQMIVITAAEVIEIAEKATLQAYRTAINDYLASTVPPNVYPWLYNYDVFPVCVGETPPGSGTTEALCTANGGEWSIHELSSKFTAHADFNDEKNNELFICVGESPSGSGTTEALCTTNGGAWIGGNIGRIPSMFDNYFTETNSEAIESRLSVALSLTYPLTPTPVGSSSSGNLLFNLCYGEIPVGSGTGEALCIANSGVWGFSHAFNFQSADKLTNLRFVDIAGQDGRLTGTVTTPQLVPHDLYFWDEDKDSETTGIWTLCPAGADDPSDCDRDSAGNPTPGAGNQKNAELLRVVLEFDFDPAVNGGVINFDTDYTNPPAIAPPVAATGTSHATITGTFLGADIIINSLPLSARYEIDRHYHTTFDIEESGTLDLGDLIPGPLALGLRFYPELPAWAFDNGWHDSIMMAYAQDYRPDTPVVPCTEPTDCIQINNLAGNNDNKISILIIAGQHDWVDEGADGFTNDVGDVFDVENDDLDRFFDARANPGNDRILIIDEL